jgi:hypothetical protein
LLGDTASKFSFVEAFLKTPMFAGPLFEKTDDCIPLVLAVEEDIR